MLSELEAASKTVGFKQSIKKLSCGEGKKAFVAKDASPSITGEIVALCDSSGVPCEWVDTMDELGRVCGIEVGAAVVVVY